VKLSRRLVITVFIILVILFLGLLFWPFVQNDILLPISLVVWLFLRILVLSIDQQYYWIALIFAVFIFLYRLLPQEQPVILPDVFINENKTINSIGSWRRLFITVDSNARDEILLKQDFTRMVVSLYAIKLHTAADYKLLDALRRGDFSLPEDIHNYLFPKETIKPGRSIKLWLQSFRNASRQWILHLTGKEKAEHYRMINEVLSFLESSLEMKNDDGKFNPNQH
jgi:hypothetical protein